MPTIQPALVRVPVVKVDPQESEPALSMPDFELPNFDIESIDFNSILNGIVHMSAPLNAGVFLMPGKYKKANVLVRPNTKAWMTVTLARNPRNEAVIASASIKISPPVKVTNPSSAYEPPGYGNGFKDLFANIVIDGIEISPEGRVLFQGKVEKGFSSEDIKTAFKPEMFPVIDLKLETLKKKKIDFDKITISELLKQFSGMLGEIKCSAMIQTIAPTLSLAALKVRTQTKSPEIHLHVRGKINSQGDIRLKSDKVLRSSVNFIDTETILEGDVCVSKLASLKPALDGHASARASLRETKLFVEYEDKSEIPISVGQDSNFVHATVQFCSGQSPQISGDGLVDVHLEEVESFRIKALKTKFRTANLHLEGSGEIIDKKPSIRGNIQATVSHPNFNWHSLHASIEGQVGVQIKAKDLMHGTIDYHVDSDRLRPFSRALGYEFFPDKRIALNPRNTGFSEFLDPVNQFVWDAKGIADPAKPPVGELGSQVWREYVQTITGAPIRKRNRVQLLIDGKQSFPKRIELIESAKHSICMQSLIFKDDESGRETAKALVEAHKRGVEVRVIVDSLGNLDSVKDLIRGNGVYDFLSENGVKLELFSNCAVKGFRNILAVVEKHRVLQGLNSLKDFVDPRQTLSTLNMFAKVARGTLNLGLDASEKKKISEALKMILGNDEQAQVTIERLANITPEKPLQLSETVAIMSQVLNLNHRWHEKYLIIDGDKAILGGMNMADEYMKGGLSMGIMVAGHERPAWRDTDILIEGEGVLDAYQNFARNWQIVNGEEMMAPHVAGGDFVGDTELQVIQSAPNRGLSHTITNLKIEALKALKPGDRAYEGTAYFIPTGALKNYVQALMDAAGRGVDVRIVTNSIESTDMPQVNQAALVTCYRVLLKAGVRIWERTGTRTMHQKTAVYGTQLGLVGSNNLDNRSGSLNSESLVVVHEPQFASQIEQMLLADMDSSVAQELKFEDIQASYVADELLNTTWAMLGDWM